MKGFTQRWGDAPVHSIGAALFAKKEQIVCSILQRAFVY